MADSATTDQLVFLMQKRNSARGAREIVWPQALVDEVRTLLVAQPSAGGFHPFVLAKNANGRLQIVAASLAAGVAKYGAADYEALLNLEAGSIALAVNLYVVAKGYQARYIYNTVPVTNGSKLCLTLALYQVI